jgi:hypothetical protein
MIETSLRPTVEVARIEPPCRPHTLWPGRTSIVPAEPVAGAQARIGFDSAPPEESRKHGPLPKNPRLFPGVDFGVVGGSMIKHEGLGLLQQD